MFQILSYFIFRKLTCSLIVFVPARDNHDEGEDEVNSLSVATGDAHFVSQATYSKSSITEEKEAGDSHSEGLMFIRDDN